MVLSLFEDFSEGEKFSTRTRTVTPTDIDLFATMSGAVNPLFLSDAYASQVGYRTRVAPGLLTLALMVGTIYQTGVFDNILALTGIDKLRFKKPVYPGDSLRSEVEVVARR
ncbi:MAG: MaoC family dehydratase, partial [Candidatus Bathyarchaeia archaeon]